MKKLTDDCKCISSIEPKKYHYDNLKVILMFNETDSYKFVYSTTKYKMNELTESYYYDNIKEVYSLKQKYYESGQLQYECNYIDNKKNGLYQEYYESGQLEFECNFINDDKNGLYQRYYEDGKMKEISHYELGILKN